MTDTEEIKKTNEKFEFNVKAGKANQQKKDVEGIVVKDIDIPFQSILLLTFKFFFAGLFIAIPIWLIIVFLMP